MNTLKAEKRSMDVKAKKLRREGYVTGNLFGREIEGSLPIQMTKKAVDQLLKTDNKGSQIMLEVDGKTYDALIKEVDYNAMANRALVSTEKVQSVAEIVLLNHEKVEAGVLQEDLEEISYKALPADLVDKVQVDVGEMKIGDVIKVKDLEIAKNPNIDLKTDPEAVVVSCTAVHNSVPEPETAEEAE